MASSPDIKKASAVLSSNRDSYLMVPCKADTWFIVELCDHVLLQQITVANFELFSSIAKTIDVSVSEHYPTEQWEHVGSLHVKDMRKEQKFKVQSQQFAKFVKFHVKDHYGNEFYCPLRCVSLAPMVTKEVGGERTD